MPMKQRFLDQPQISIACDQSLKSMKKSGKVRKYFRFNVHFLEMAELKRHKSVKVIVDEEENKIGFKFYLKKDQKGALPLSHNRGGHMSLAAQKILDEYGYENIHLRPVHKRKFFPYRIPDPDNPQEEIWVIELDNPGK